MPKENFIEYLSNKRSELKHLRFRDVLLARAVTSIHQHTRRKEMKYVSLSSISPIHCIDRENAIQKVRERATILLEYKDELRKIKRLNKETLLKYLPSISGIKVIKDKNDKYISFEGNGRVEAFKQVFKNDDNIQLQVEEFILNDYDKILRRVERVRKRNFPEKQ